MSSTPTPTPTGPIPATTLAAARLDGDDSLAVFRTLLAAAARPGQLVSLRTDLTSAIPAPLLAALALVDLDHAIAVLGDEPGVAARAAARSTDADPSIVSEWAEWAQLIAAATDACPTDVLDDADVVIARRVPTVEEVSSLRTGSASTPELGARLFIACQAIRESPGGAATDDAESSRFGVSGPGASTPRRVEVIGVGHDVLAAVADANRAFPAGIDVWFIDAGGTVVGIPRSASITLDRAADQPAHTPTSDGAN